VVKCDFWLKIEVLTKNHKFHQKVCLDKNPNFISTFWIFGHYFRIIVRKLPYISTKKFREKSEDKVLFHIFGVKKSQFS